MDLSIPGLDKHGDTIDFYLSPTRNAQTAKRFLGKALNGFKAWEQPEVINTNKAPTYGVVISDLKGEGKCPEKMVHRQVKYLNNGLETDLGKPKQLIQPVRGFKTLRSNLCRSPLAPCEEHAPPHSRKCEHRKTSVLSRPLCVH